MRLENYFNIDINEENDRFKEKIDNILRTLFKDCSFYIENLRKSNAFKLLYRSTNNSAPFIQLKTSNLERGRNPKDTGIVMHNLLNEKIFKPKFGWNVRDGVFASSKQLPYYGDPYLFFPIDKYEFVWSPEIKDLYDDMFKTDKLDFLYWYSEEVWLRKKADGDKIENGNIIKVEEKDIEKKIDNLKKMYQNDDLKMAVRSEHEISFNVNKYYLVNPYITDNFNKWLLDLIYHPEDRSKYAPF